jgi:broad specificity phosphatase PhoE
VDDTGQQAKEVAQEAKGRLREQADQRSTQAGEQITSAADDVRSVAQELRTQGKDTPARYAEQAAEKAQQVGQRLQDASGDELLRDVEDFARRNPWAVAAGGLVLGLAASRMLKASSGERYRASVSNGHGSSGHSGARFERDEGSMISTEPRS